MSDDPQVAVALVAMIAAVVAVILGVVVLNARYRRSRMEAWRAYASSRDLRFFATEGPWYRWQDPVMRGARDGVDFIIDLHVVGYGKHRTTFTRILTTCDRAGQSKVTLRPNNIVVTVARAFGMKYAETGDAHFDARIAARAKDGVAVGKIFDASTRERMLQINRRFYLTIKEGVATLEWQRWEKDEAVLDSAVAAMAALGVPQHRLLEKVGR
jgi:hypothetical protein